MTIALRHATRDAPGRTLGSGALIGGFRVERVVATRSDLYTVIEATAPAGERVTLTLLAPAIVGDRELRRRLLRLATLRAAIDHPNLLPFHGAREDRGRLYLVSAVAGPLTLADRLVAGPVRGRQAVSLLGQVAGALETAAQHGLLHSDLTPQAIALAGDRGGHPLLGDFGIAMPPARGCELLTAAEDADYRSPEEVRGEPLGSESNVYSLACILFECLTGATPYPYERPVLTLHAHVVEPPPRLSERSPDLPTALDAVMARAMAKDPRERYGSPAELIRAAGQALGTETEILVIAPAPQERRVGPTAPARRRFRPRARLATVGIGLALLASAASGFATGSVDWSREASPSTAVRSPAPPTAHRLQQAAYLEEVTRAVDRLRARRRTARGRVRAARRAVGQAAGARALARAYRDTRKTLPSPPAGSRREAPLAEGLLQAERAYRKLAAAARGSKRRAWRVARREALRRERALERTLQAVHHD
jgi:serine/threonine protein kinase